jgi:hypothetical protein
VADGTTPLAQAYRAYEQVEGQLSAALDQLVATNGFADLLATSATNVMALTRMANGAVDRIVRATRLAARQDVTQLARQLARTEDKLERLLQAVEELQESLDSAAPQDPAEGVVPSVPSVPPKPAVKATAAKPAVKATAATVNGRVGRARTTGGGGSRRARRQEPS